MNEMNQFKLLEKFGGEREKHVCHLLSDKLGLGVGALKEGAK